MNWCSRSQEDKMPLPLELVNHYIYNGGKGQRRLLSVKHTPAFQSIVAAPTFFPIDYGRTWGGDFSGDYDGVIDWVKFYAAGGRFAFIKAVNGTIPTKYFAQNWANAKAAGVLRAAYFWLYKNQYISGTAQAKAWAKAIQGDPGELPGMIDFEWTSWMGKPANPDASDLWGAAIPFEQLVGRKPMIYSAPGYTAQYLNAAAVWATYPLVVAQYQVPQPYAIAPWGNAWTFWQAAPNAD